MKTRRGGLMLAIMVMITSCMPAARAFLDIPDGRPAGGEAEAGAITMGALDSMLARLDAVRRFPG